MLGFVNAAGEGQYGVEGSLNKQLKGRDGLLQSVTDVRNIPLTVGKIICESRRNLATIWR